MGPFIKDVIIFYPPPPLSSLLGLNHLFGKFPSPQLMPSFMNGPFGRELVDYFMKCIFLWNLHLPAPHSIMFSNIKNSWTFSKILGKWHNRKKNTMHSNIVARFISEARCLFFFFTLSCVICNRKKYNKDI